MRGSRVELCGKPTEEGAKGDAWRRDNQKDAQRTNTADDLGVACVVGNAEPATRVRIDREGHGGKAQRGRKRDASWSSVGRDEQLGGLTESAHTGTLPLPVARTVTMSTHGEAKYYCLTATV